METLAYKKKTVTARRAEAVKWYQEIVGTKKPTASNFQIYKQETGIKPKIGPGYLLHYTYIAKHRKELPYFDAFPLALILDVKKDSFLTCNLHYLGHGLREKALKALYDNITNKNRSGLQKVKFNYQMVKEISKHSIFKPTIKKHLLSHIKSTPIAILPKDFQYVVHLPSEDFIGAKNTKVWYDSAKIIKGKK